MLWVARWVAKRLRGELHLFCIHFSRRERPVSAVWLFTQKW